MLGHFWFTRCSPLIIIIDEEENVHTQIDGAHTAHAYCEGHSVLLVPIGTGDMINFSKKLGVGAVSYTES